MTIEAISTDGEVLALMVVFKGVKVRNGWKPEADLAERQAVDAWRWQASKSGRTIDYLTMKWLANVFEQQTGTFEWSCSDGDDRRLPSCRMMKACERTELRLAGDDPTCPASAVQMN